MSTMLTFKNSMLTDHYGRAVTSLRISITKKCNLNCIYCHQEGESDSSNREIALDTIVKIVTSATEFGVRKVKFSGGEPLMRSDFEDIIVALPELKDISATTNGVLLSQRAASLADSGLDRVNISLPSLNKEHHRTITGNPHALPKVIDGINAAIDAGLTPIKLNMVLLRGINESEIDGAINFAARFDGDVILQLIELMNFKNISQFMVDIDSVERMLESRSVFTKERQMHRRKKYLIDGVEVELVRPIDNSKFCASCNRLRVTSSGKLKPCLMRNDNLVDISEKATVEEIREKLKRIVELREPYYKNVAPKKTIP
ncbi:cyclic pyranopterin monophosphate synthase subunit MoaA [Candidatus Methanoperedens nitroreducens]|uniref:Probable GTP 3',8-cyclase n=2 Tax=Candidatus Methanoperedens nitratireducens TaxID=1392998 RepID=A0A062VDP1_9EURY|nr:cyclic pyranopterin monophosphate synthase subunit MoaA [Candidatus Methanoperedens nitroreducens]